MILKGILSPQDARLAQEHGVDALIVSNHGGRQLDGALPPILALPAIRKAVPRCRCCSTGRAPRHGCGQGPGPGADAVLLGRPFNYAAALGGQAGVAQAIELLAAELHRDLALVGAWGCDDLDPSFVATG